MTGSVSRGFHDDNRLVGALAASDRARLIRLFDRVLLNRDAILFRPGDTVEHVHFPCEGSIVALMVNMEDGAAVETVTIGREGAVGGIVSQGAVPAFATALVRNGGPALRISVASLQRVKADSPALRNLLTRYSDCLLAQMLQSVACNALHPLDSRCARWLLSTQDRIGGDELFVTQEELAGTLGVQRSYVSRILRQLSDDGLLRVGRGRITLLDRAALERKTCECYVCVRRHFETVLGGVYPTAELMESGS